MQVPARARPGARRGDGSGAGRPPWPPVAFDRALRGGRRGPAPPGPPAPLHRRPAAGERRRRRCHGRDLLAGRQLGRGVGPLADGRRLVLDGAGERLEQAAQPAAVPAAARQPAATSAATRAGVARNSRSRARQARQVRRCGRSSASPRAVASPSASADSLRASRSHSAPAWIPSSRSRTPAGPRSGSGSPSCRSSR